MPQGKAAGERCVQLDGEDRCLIFADPRRPSVCGSLQPSPDMCGHDRGQAMRRLSQLERQTADAVAEDTRKPYSNSGHNEAVADLKDFLGTRAEVVDAWLAEGGHCPARW